ncbi:MAG: Ig-like domain-containing protein [Rubrivivax sp.]
MADSRRLLRALGTLTLAAALGACGSGGGDGDAATNGSSAGSGSGSTATAGSGATGSTGSGGSGTTSGTGSGTGSGSTSSSSVPGTTGGSGGSSPGPAAAANVSSGGSLQITAPSTTYPGGSDESATWRDLNTARVAAGAGWLVQSTELDTAAAAHSSYLVTNIGSSGHAEDPTKPAYYEASPASRVAKAGFAASFTAETLSDFSPQINLQPLDCAAELLNTVYNAVALLGPATHVGLHGWATTYSGAQFCIGLVAAPSNRPEGQVVPAGKMVAYPYDGQTGVVESVNLQVESPRPSSTALPNDLAGTPVIVNVRNADYLNLGMAGSLNAKVTEFQMVDPSSGSVVPAAILAHAALQGSGVVLVADAYLPVGTVVLVPLSPLLRGHTYTVSFMATLKDGGPTLQKSWSFTTRP